MYSFTHMTRGPAASGAASPSSRLALTGATYDIDGGQQLLP